MARAIWSPKAQSELEEILFYIRVRDGRPETARRIGEQIHDEAELVASGAYPGQTLPYAPEAWLYFRFKRWLVFYQPHSDGIEVMRVIDSARDLPQQFDAPL